jgi:hypothetical protein
VTSTASVQQVNKLSPNTTAQLTQGITNLGVNNISTYAATEDELHILALGENFIFEPKDITDIEIWDAFDDFADTLSFKESDFSITNSMTKTAYSAAYGQNSLVRDNKHAKAPTTALTQQHAAANKANKTTFKAFTTCPTTTLTILVLLTTPILVFPIGLTAIAVVPIPHKTAPTTNENSLPINPRQTNTFARLKKHLQNR